VPAADECTSVHRPECRKPRSLPEPGRPGARVRVFPEVAGGGFQGRRGSHRGANV
jgi:hypothetical protein